MSGTVSAVSPTSAARTTPPTALPPDPVADAKAMIAQNRSARTGINYGELLRDIDQLNAKDGAYGAQVENAIKAELGPANTKKLMNASYSIRAKDGSTLVMARNAPSIEQYYKGTAHASLGKTPEERKAYAASDKAHYARLDKMVGDGNAKTFEGAKIQEGLNDLLSRGYTLDQVAQYKAEKAAEAKAAADKPFQLANAGDVKAAADYIRANPDQIEAVISAFAQTRPSLIPELVEAGGTAVASLLDEQSNKPSLGNRIWGGVRALGGGIEAIAGGALILAPEPTMLTKAGGSVLAVHGADNFVAGMRQAISGKEAESLTQQSSEALALALGADEVTAKRIGIGVDVGVGLAGSGLAALGRLSSASKLVWGSIKATQPVYAGTVIPKSFELTAGSTRIWVHGNASEHIAERAISMLGKGVSPNMVNLSSQIQLTSLQAAVAAATKNGVVVDKLITIGGWELKFAAARDAGKLPVLIHALPK